MKTWKLQNKSRKGLSKKSKRKVDEILKQDKQLNLAYKTKEFFLHISPYSNGGAKRANRTMKQAKNQAFGYRNLTHTEKLMILRTSSPH